MPRDPRTYITVHDGMPDHPKIDPLSDGAFRLLVSLWCWCSRNETDGKVPAATWKKRGTPKKRDELIAAGLVEHDGDDMQMHDYLQHQRSAAEIAVLRKTRSDAGRKGGKAKARGLANAKQVLEQMPSKSVADTEGSLREPQKSHSPTSTGSRNAPVGTVARIVRLYVESSSAAGLPAPEESQDRVSRGARSLIDQGYQIEQIEDAARNAGACGWADLATQLQRDAARAKPATNGSATDRPSTTDQRFRGALDLADQLERKAIG